MSQRWIYHENLFKISLPVSSAKTADIYEEVRSSLEALDLDTECLGGGRIAHNPSSKPQIKVYGYSQV